MSSLRIEHRTLYTYARPVALGRHRLVLRPREGHDLHVRSMDLQIAPAHRLTWSRDVFGNSIATADFLETSTVLDIHSQVTIDRSAPFVGDASAERTHISFPVVYDPLEAAIAGAYQAATYPEEIEEVTAWVRQVLPSPDPLDAEANLYVLGGEIFKNVKYRRREEKGVQSPAQTLAIGSGSCRDLATLLMDAARALGVATRFASGYLDCPASVAGNAAMHAWTEIYLPAIGWRGFDPTLGEPTSLKHVVTGVSNHPRGVMPISGMFTGAASDYQSMDVEVRTEVISE